VSAIAANAAAENLDELEYHEQRKNYANSLAGYMTYADVKNMVRTSENKLLKHLKSQD
jgi:hypothetical protein